MTPWSSELASSFGECASCRNGRDRAASEEPGGDTAIHEPTMQLWTLTLNPLSTSTRRPLTRAYHLNRQTRIHRAPNTAHVE